MKKSKVNVTINDVAKGAGVSKTTVSRYLNGKLEFMSEESRKRIQDVIEELNYRPNNLARSLKSSKSKLIGLLIADIGSHFSSILVKGVTDCCNEYGYNVLIANTDNSTAKEQDYIQSMVDQRVEGIIVNTTGDNTEFLKEIAQKYIPIVLADRPIFPTLFDTVRTNDYESTVQAIQYLVQEGFKQVAFFTEPINNVGTRLLRKQAYEQACCELGLTVREYVVNSEDELAQQSIKDFLAASQGEACAVFTVNGVTMLRVIRIISKLGLRFPEDIGICGFDNWPWMELIGPGITVISQPSYNVGIECVKRLMLHIEKKEISSPKIYELPNELIIRGSTKLIH